MTMAAALLLPLGVAWPGLPAQAQERLGVGGTPSPEQIAGWDIDVRPDGEGLPEGRGSVSEGRQVYESRCVSCHGTNGEGPMDRLVGGTNSLASEKPVKTVGSYWPYATTLFDYVHRAMPFDEPQSLSADEVYAVSAYVLNMNGLVPDDAVMDAQTLANVQMPNRDGFYGPDPRPDVTNMPCMSGCEPLIPDLGKDQVLTPDQVQ
jgi:cytochrome c